MSGDARNLIGQVEPEKGTQAAVAHLTQESLGAEWLSLASGPAWGDAIIAPSWQACTGGAIHLQLGRAVAEQLPRPRWARHMQRCATKDVVLAEVLGPNVCRVRLSADRMNLLPTKLVGGDGAEEKKKLA